MCPLCKNDKNPESLLSAGRAFSRCAVCRLTFVPKDRHLSPDEERGRYEQHRNDVSDPAYRAFLQPTADAIQAKVPPPARGLDFGAGPGPALARMLEERGYVMSLYDVYFHPDREALESVYDFIVCTETAEHFCDPRAEFLRLKERVTPGGWIAIRTELFLSSRNFEQWHYPRDPTHVSIYAPETLEWIASWLSLKLEVLSPHLALFQKAGE